MIGTGEVQLIAPPVREQHCRICGLRRKPGEPDENWVVDVVHMFKSRSQVRIERDGDGSERLSAPEKPWSRRHVACVAASWWVVERLTGVEVGVEQGREVLKRFGSSPLAGDRQAPAREPFGFLTARERARLVSIAREATAPTEPVVHAAGRCGVCGQSESLEWTFAAGIAWSDGRPAPVCHHCALIVPIPGGDLDRDLLRIRAVADLAAVRPAPSLRGHNYYGIQLAHEVLHADERHEDGAGRWVYRPAALDAIAERVRELRPELVIDPVERALRQRVLDARRAEAAAETRRRADESAIGAPTSAWS